MILGELGWSGSSALKTPICAAGTYSTSGYLSYSTASSGSNQISYTNGCTSCPAGSYSSSNGATSCSSCIAGTYSSTTGNR